MNALLRIPDYLSNKETLTDIVTYPFFGQEFRNDRTQHTGESTDTIREPHQNTGKAWSDVKVIDIETYQFKI